MKLLHYRNTFPALNLSVSFIHHDMNTIFIFNFFKTTFCIANDTEKHSFSFILRTNENNFRDICNHSDQNFVHFLFLSFISGYCLYYKITFQLKSKNKCILSKVFCDTTLFVISSILLFLFILHLLYLVALYMCLDFFWIVINKISSLINWNIFLQWYKTNENIYLKKSRHIYRVTRYNFEII